MGVDNRQFELIANLLRRDKPGTMLVAGYPDFIVYPKMLTKFLDRSDFPADPRSDWLKVGHHCPDLDYMRRPEAVYAALGYEAMTVVDIQCEMGETLIADLNVNQGDRLGKFDLVHDHGTIEHCFNVAQALMNLANAVREGGYIYLHLPLNCFNHGFWNFNPITFLDFFMAENGFQVKLLECYSKRTETAWVPNVNEFAAAPPQTYIDLIAQRKTLCPLHFPSQARYR